VSARYAGPVIDAHHHVWELGLGKHPWLRPGVRVPHRYGDYETIKRDYTPHDLLADAAGTGLVATVYMEAEWDPDDPLGETAYVTELSERTGVPGAMAAQAWLDADDAAAVLAAHAANPIVRSVRHKPGGPTNPYAAGGRTLMGDPRWRAGYAHLAEHGLHFELQTPWWNLHEANDLAAWAPETLIVVNHSGVITDRDPATVSAWAEAMRRVAARPNIVVKASGLGVEGEPWTVESNRAIVHELLDTFGADRVMWGSNFPVDGMFGGYAELLDGYREILADRTAAEQRAFFHDTAQRIYRPDPIK
jgi:predicted TIM-barrel fold metal-dependent hydrolase